MGDGEEQQGELSARDRLAQISHHFLSESTGSRPSVPAQTPAQQERDFRVLLPAAPETLPFSTVVLARQLAQGSRRAVGVLEMDAGLYALVQPIAASGGQPDAGPRPPAARNPEIVLLAGSAPSAPGSRCDLVLLAVPCDDPGMRRSYVLLKQLIAAKPERIGITMTAASDREQAEFCFNKFAVAAYNFLGIEIASYAFLSAEPCAASSGPPDADLRRVADLLLEDWRARRSILATRTDKGISMPTRKSGRDA